MLPGVEQADVGAIHRARVASRRLRELLPVLQLEETTTRKLERALRKVTRRLGPVRELDVLRPLLDELHEAGRVGDQAFKRLSDALRTARHDVADRTAAAELARAARKLHAASSCLDVPETRTSVRAWRWALDARIARRASGLRAAIDEAGAMYVPERLHAVRIALKKLRYGVELSAEAQGSKNSADLRRLKRSQERLGRWHDLQVLMQYVRQEQAALAPADFKVRHELDGLMTRLENNCRALHAQYVRDRTVLMALCDRLVAGSDRRHAALRVG
jgi:CHAD domain-containing protein